MVYTFARVDAAVSMKVEDYFVQGRRVWIRLHEKGGHAAESDRAGDGNALAMDQSDVVRAGT